MLTRPKQNSWGPFQKLHLLHSVHLKLWCHHPSVPQGFVLDSSCPFIPQLNPLADFLDLTSKIHSNTLSVSISRTTTLSKHNLHLDYCSSLLPGMALTEKILRRGGKYTQKNCTKKVFMTHDLEPDILEWKSSEPQEASLETKLVEVMEFQQWFWSSPKTKSLTFPPSICHEVMKTDAMIFVFWMWSFKPTFSLSSFTFIKRR